MNKLAMIIGLLTLPGLAQPRNCLRIMPVDELTRTAALIARVKVVRTEKVNYRGSYSQFATLHPVDVLEGDFTLKEVNVLARSNVQCAEDNYINGQEMLVFLVQEESLYRTVNFQYGQFQIVGEVVKGWRDKANKPADKPYTEVLQEVETYLNPPHSPETNSPPPVKPPQPTPQPPGQPATAPERMY